MGETKEVGQCHHINKHRTRENDGFEATKIFSADSRVNGFGKPGKPFTDK